MASTQGDRTWGPEQLQGQGRKINGPIQDISILIRIDIGKDERENTINSEPGNL